MSGKHLRIAWFSIYNRDKAEKGASTSAYFSDVLLPKLHPNFDIDLYGYEEGRLNDQRIRHFLSASRYHLEEPYDLFFYQYEDSQAADFIRMQIGLMPGLTLFHDLLLKSECPPPLTFSVWPELVENFNKGINNVPIKSPQPDRGPFAYREVSLAPVSLYSSQRLCGEARRHVSESLGRIPLALGATKIYLAHPVEMKLSLQQSEIQNDDIFRIGFVGHPGFENRAHKVLQALRNVDGELYWLLEKKDEAQALELLKEFSISKYKLFFGESPVAWQSIVNSLDVALHPLFSAYGTPRAYLAISLANGVPSIVTDFGDGEFLPDDIVFKITPGHQEVAFLRENIEAIRGLDSAKRHTLSEAAFRYAKENFSSDIIAAELGRIFEKITPEFKKIYSRWSELYSWARAEVVNENVAAYDQALIEPTFREFNWLGDSQ